MLVTSRNPNIILGPLILDDSYTPIANVSFEYYKTQGEEIIGGIQKINITGTVTVDDKSSSSTGAMVMSKLKSIRNLGKSSQCIPVSIPGIYAGQGKVVNVNIEQGPDPSWVNQGAYSLEIITKLPSLPSNSFGITNDDNVTEFNRIENIEIGEDAHGYVASLQNNLTLSKTYVKYGLKINLTCAPICPNLGGRNANTLNTLTRILTSIPMSPVLIQYQSWIPLLQNRSLTMSTDGSVEFSSDIILLPPGSSSLAFVDLNYEHNRSYQDKKTSKKISGSITGLSSIQWSNLITIGDTSSESKLANAENAFQAIKGSINDISYWSGLLLELQKLPNCPSEISDCGRDRDNPGDIKPTSSTISKDRTEGTINFSFEWASGDDGDCEDENGVKKELTVDITEPQPSLIEHIIPGVGTLIQNLNCSTAKTIEFTSTTTYPENSCASAQRECETENRINEEINQYIPNEGDNWLVIKHTKTTTKNSFIINKKYIRHCFPS